MHLVCRVLTMPVHSTILCCAGKVNTIPHCHQALWWWITKIQLSRINKNHHSLKYHALKEMGCIFSLHRRNCFPQHSRTCHRGFVHDNEIPERTCFSKHTPTEVGRLMALSLPPAQPKGDTIGLLGASVEEKSIFPLLCTLHSPALSEEGFIQVLIYVTGHENWTLG